MAAVEPRMTIQPRPRIRTILRRRVPTDLVELIEKSEGQFEEFVAEVERDPLYRRLHDAGYVTAGFSANPQLQGQQGWNQGFDAWRTFPAFKLPGPELTRACLRWLDEGWTRGAGQPVFLYLQYMEPHAAYEPAEPFRSRYVVDDDGKPFDVARVIRDVIERAYPGTAVDEQGQPLDLAVALQRFVADPLAARILAGEFVKGDRIRVDARENSLAFVAERT